MMGDRNNPSIHVYQWVSDQEIPESVKTKHRIAYAKWQLDKINTFLKEDPWTVLKTAKEDEATKDNDYQRCLNIVEKTRNEANEILSHSDDLRKAIEKQNKQATRLSDALSAKARYDDVVGMPLTESMLSQLPQQGQEDYNLFKWVIEDATKQIQEWQDTINIVTQKTPSLQNAIRERQEFIKKAEDVCQRTRQSKLDLIAKRVELSNLLDEKLIEKKVYEDYLIEKKDEL